MRLLIITVINTNEETLRRGFRVCSTLLWSFIHIYLFLFIIFLSVKQLFAALLLLFFFIYLILRLHSIMFVRQLNISVWKNE